MSSEMESPRQETTGGLARDALIVAAVAIGLAAGLALMWVAASAVLVLFAGILLGVALDAGARALGPVLRGHHRIRLGIVVLLFAALIAGIVAWGGSTLVLQFGELSAIVKEQTRGLLDVLAGWGLGRRPDGSSDLSGMLPNMSVLAGGATNAIFSLFGTLGNLLVVFFIGVFFAAEPDIYKAGVLSLVPKAKRPRMAEVLGRTGKGLRGWLLGQSISMAVVFAFTWMLLSLVGMPYALLLAVQAGLLTFIPTLGPAVAGIIIVLVGLAQGLTMAAWGLGVYLLIQLLESNILTPMVQERTTRMPPVLSIGVQIVMGALFGILGLALAVPLAAAGKVLVRELYIKDVLGGGVEPEDI